MPRAAFPSEDFPAYPSVSLDTPDGWQPRTIAGTLLAVVDDRGADAFSPNVIVGITRTPAGHSLDDAIAAIKGQAAQLPDVAPIDAAKVDLEGREWWVTEFAYASAAAGTIVQVVAVTVVDNGPACDVIRVTGTASPADYETSLPVIRQIVAGAVVGG